MFGLIMPGKVRTLNEIAELYGVHRNTIRKWIRPIRSKLNLGNKRLLMTWQVRMIFEFLDYPDGIEEAEIWLSDTSPRH